MKRAHNSDSYRHFSINDGTGMHCGKNTLEEQSKKKTRGEMGPDNKIDKY